ncbi:hypothetical protein OK016_03705 [Vibrio chagasii]|nr:hypothetical protein [Vibrio chagasii]
MRGIGATVLAAARHYYYQSPPFQSLEPVRKKWPPGQEPRPVPTGDQSHDHISPPIPQFLMPYFYVRQMVRSQRSGALNGLFLVNTVKGVPGKDDR